MKKDKEKPEIKKNKETKYGCIILFVLAIGIIFAVSKCSDDPRTPDQKFVDTVIMDSFGKNSHLVEAVKAQLNDPNSFEHLETTVYNVPEQDYFIVHMNYTAKNGFGGRVKSRALAHFYKSGKLEILEFQ